MKKLLVLSGKGGTGKTTVASSLIRLTEAKAYADCDVDAPNLHLVMTESSEPVKSDFYGLPTALINPDKCISCDQCRQSCRFDAISVDDIYKVDNYSCEGCRVCTIVCPVEAIQMIPRVTGYLSLYKNSHVFSTAELKMGSGNSGLLVTEVKKNLYKNSENEHLAIIDGSPGIGCPVIASISGVDLVLVVTEPTISGFSDMERILKTAGGFPAKLAVCINKYDLHYENSKKIKDYCSDNGVRFIGMIPFEKDAPSMINKGKTLVDKEGPARDSIVKILEKSLTILYEED